MLRTKHYAATLKLFCIAVHIDTLLPVTIDMAQLRYIDVIKVSSMYQRMQIAPVRLEPFENYNAAYRMPVK